MAYAAQQLAVEQSTDAAVGGTLTSFSASAGEIWYVDTYQVIQTANDSTTGNWDVVLAVRNADTASTVDRQSIVMATDHAPSTGSFSAGFFMYGGETLEIREDADDTSSANSHVFIVSARRVL